MKNTFAILALCALGACATIKPPEIAGELGRVENTVAQAVMVRAIPPAPTCTARGAEVLKNDGEGRFIFIYPLRGAAEEGSELVCRYEDGREASTIIHRTLLKDAWNRQRNLRMAGAFIGGGPFGAIGVAMAGVDPGYVTYPALNHVILQDAFPTSDLRAEARDSAVRAWDEVIAALHTACASPKLNGAPCEDQYAAAARDQDLRALDAVFATPAAEETAPVASDAR